MIQKRSQDSRDGPKKTALLKQLVLGSERTLGTEKFPQIEWKNKGERKKMNISLMNCIFDGSFCIL